MKLYDEPQGGAGEADDGALPAPDDELLNPLAKKLPAPTLTPGLPDVSAAPPPPVEGFTATPGAIQPMTPVPAATPVATPPPPVAAPTPIETLSGAWTPPVASTQSAPLIASAAGGTMTPQGDSANSMRGYENAEGGGMGGFAADKADPAAWSRVANGDPQAIQQAMASKDPALQKAAADMVTNWINNSDKQGAGYEILSKLTPEQRAQIGAGSTGALKNTYDNFNEMAGAGLTWQQAQSGGANFGGIAGAGKEAVRRATEDKILAATFIPGVGTSRIEGQNVIWAPTGQVIGTVNDDPAKLKAAVNALGVGSTGDFAMSANGQVVPASELPAQAPVTAPSAGNWTAKDPAEQAAGLTAQGLPATGPLPGVAPLPGGIIEEQTDVGGQGFPPRGAPAGAPTPGGLTATPGKVQTTQTGPQLPGMAPVASGAPTSAPSTAPKFTPTDPNNPLTNQTIDYGDMADRFKIAQSELENWNKTSEPQFQADLRRAMQKAAAGGALGSGMLQTGLGDIALNRETQRQGMGTSFLNNALTGTIGDAKDRAALAERQQGFQAGQQGTAFNQGVTEAELSDRLTGNQFQRELQKLIAGSSGNPADTQLALSGIFGNAGADASNALSGLIKGKTANGASDASSGNYFAELLKQLLGGGGGDTTMTPVATTVYGGQ